MTRFDWNFAALIAAQTLHSLEEYYGRLWQVFPPAAFVTGLISENHRFGFIVFNLGLIAFGIWCFLYPIRSRWAAIGGVVAFWGAIEFINGIGHPLWSLRAGGYTPGVMTAPLLLILAVSLLWHYSRERHVTRTHQDTNQVTERSSRN